MQKKSEKKMRKVGIKRKREIHCDCVKPGKPWW